MSIRDELAQVIAVALAETNPSGLGTFDELSSNRQKQLLSRCGHAADAILARFGVVELPEPEGDGDDITPHNWSTADGYIEANTGSVYIGYEIGGRTLDPGDARTFAAALLAAANRAEATDVDR